VRELEHVIEGAFNIVPENETIKIEHLPYYIRKSYIDCTDNEIRDIDKQIHNIAAMKRNNLSLSEYLSKIEEELIVEALKLNDYNITKTAEYLGIKRQGLQYKLKKIYLQNPMF
jgi:arginine utilization regulatory protein